MMKMPALSWSMSFLVLLIGIILFVFTSFAIAIAVIAALIVPVTFLYGLATRQSYNRVCDNSEIIYQLNRIGKWTIVSLIGIGVIYLLLV